MFSKSPIYRKSNVQGNLYTYYKAGNKVKKGDSLGHITNPFGLVIQEIRARVSGIILNMKGLPPTNIDDTFFA